MRRAGASGARAAGGKVGAGRAMGPILGTSGVRRPHGRACTRNAALRGFPGAGERRAGEGTMLRTVIVPSLVLLAALLGVPGEAAAAVPETPRFRIIGAAQGLPSTDFFGIARDRAGYVCIATDD